MAELLVDFITSLDGYASAEGWPGWWGLEGPEYLAWLGESPEADWTVLMGATTYRLMSRSSLPRARRGGSTRWDAMRKVVFSSTLDRAAGLGEHPPRRRGPRRGGPVDEGR